MSGLRTAARRLAATPIFSGVSVLTIALAIAANSAMFSLVDAVLLRPPPFKDPAGLLQVWSVQSGGFEVPYVRPGIVGEWQRLTDVFTAIEPYEFRGPTLIGAGEPDLVPAAALGAGLMPMLGVAPLLGRTLQPADSRPDRALVAVIAESLWTSRFGRDPRIIGRTMRLDDQTYEIVGVMRRAFRFPRSHQIWIPLKPSAAGPPRPGQAVARLRPGVSVDLAQQLLEAAARAVDPAASSPDESRVRLRPFGEGTTGHQTRVALLVLLASVGFVLVICCANLAGLMLVRGTARQKELAIRAAMGAGRLRLMRPLVAEAALLVAAAAVLGVIAAGWAIDLLVRYSPAELVRLSHNDVAPGWRVFGFTTGLAFLTATLVGLMPGWRASRVDAADALRAGVAGGTGSRQQRLREVIVMAQLALSVVLLVGAGLLARTFIGLTRVDPGFDTEHVLAVDLSVQQWKYRTPAARRQFFENITARLRQLPGVRRVALSGGIPPGGGFSRGLRLVTDDGRVYDDDQLTLTTVDVDAGYFAALGLALRDGRTFTGEEIAAHGDLLVISETFASRLWPHGRAVGRRFRVEDEDRWYTVVGVAADVFQIDYTRPRATFAEYVPLSERVPLVRTIVIRTDGDPARFEHAVRAAIRAVDPDQPIFQIGSAAELYSSFLAAPRFYAWMMSVFAIAAALLAAIGVYGVFSYAVALRAREFGIRLALGARGRDLRNTVLRRALGLVLGGLTLGVAASLLAGRVTATLLVGVDPGDLYTYAAVIGTVTAATLAACWIPAHRAAATDPVVTLRIDA